MTAALAPDRTLPTHDRDRSTRTAQLLREAARSDGDRRRDLLDEVVLLNLEVADSVARRFRDRGIDAADLQQTAREALLKAVRRFDPAKAEDLLTYAVPVIRGEVQHYFRDRGWMVRPPRSVQELQWRTSRLSEAMTHELGRSPGADELVDRLGVSRSDYDRARGAQGCYTPTSLDQPIDVDGTATASETLGGADSELETAEARLVLGPALRRLPERERRMVRMRFFDERTQEDIGRSFGLSQPQVSRVMRRILTRLRADLGEDTALPA